MASKFEAKNYKPKEKKVRAKKQKTVISNLDDLNK